MRRFLVALLASLLAACASAPRSPLEPLRSAAGRAEKGGGGATTLALAGWHELFEGGDVARATALAEQAVADSPSDPWARLLRAQLASRALDPEAEADELLALIEGAPTHPLAMVAAGQLGSFFHRSAPLDEELGTRIEALLAREGIAPEVRVRLRGALRVLRLGQSVEAAAPQIAASGLVTAGSVVGPLSSWHALEAEKSFPPESASPVQERYGERRLRPFSFPDGTISLRGEEPDGDVYYVLAVAELPEAGRYVIRLATAGSTTAAVAVDGVPVVARSAIRGTASVQAAQAVELAAGPHLVAIRVVRGRGGGDAWVALAPADGSPSAVRFRAAQPGDGPGTPPRLVEDPSLPLAESATALAAHLGEEAGAVGIWAAALDATRRDVQAARDLVDRGLAHAPRALPLLSLRAELIRRDPTIPDSIGRARAATDQEAILAVDPENPRALVAVANTLAGAGRHDDALARLEQARAAAPGSSAPDLARARIALSRGFDEEALAGARALTGQGADRCAAWSIVYELSRRIDAVADTDAAIEALGACGNARSKLVGHLAGRGREAEAIALARTLLEEAPQDTGAAYRLADLLAASGSLEEAVEILERQEAYWPRNAWIPRRRAELLERAGDADGARAARERALALDGGDLPLRRRASLESTGRDVLEDVARDGLALIRAFERNPRRFDSPSVLLLDFAAIEVYENGSYVERVHTVSRVLDKRGIDDLGEVHLPPGAEVIHLRTIKPDGRVLVPEAIAGKDSISMPGLEVGDYVEQEYLVAHGPRSAALPGWTASPFYFRSANVPFVESVYVVRARREAGLELDVHNGMEGVAVEERDGWLTLTLRRQEVPALVPEPASPSGREFLPWAQVGAGADETRLFPLFADNLAGLAAPTLDVERWARSVAATVDGGDRLAIVRALYDRAMEEIEGSERSLRGSAAEVLARGRGNRLLLLKAALASLGIEARYAAIRPFPADPAPYRFPDDDRWGRIALVVRTSPDAGWIWLDPTQRWAPFGSLASVDRGVSAWVLPEPGETVARRTSTPEDDGARNRQTELRLSLDADGTLRGEGAERYFGQDGAAVRVGLERLDEERRRQAIESSLARQFPGVTLESHEVEYRPDSVEIRYRIEVPNAARDLGEGRLLLRLSVFEAELGRKFLGRSQRETPLLVASPVRTETSLHLELPEGATVERGVEAEREHSAFGDLKRDVGMDGRTVAIRETLDVERGRIPPERYPEFAAWVSAVDRAQAVELVIRR